MCTKTCVSFAVLLLVCLFSCLLLGCGVSVKIGTSAEVLAITSISPGSITAGSDATKFVVSGKGFQRDSTIKVSDVSLATIFIDNTQLQATVPSEFLATAGLLPVTVQNAGAHSAAKSLSVSVTNPAPVLMSVSPSSAVVDTDVTLTIRGRGFATDSTVLVDGKAHSKVFINSTQIAVSLQSSELNRVGNLIIAVENCAPGGGVSEAATFTALPEPLALLGKSPGFVQVGSPDTVITLTGTGFARDAKVYASGMPSVLDTVTEHLIKAVIPSSLLQAQGAINLEVVDPGTPAMSSNVVQVMVGEVPKVMFVSPSSAPVGSADLKITVTGSGFVPGSVVQWNGTNLETSAISSESALFARVPAAMLAQPANNSITVAVPSLGIASSTSTPFTAYLQIANNDIVYRSQDGYLYAAVAASAATGARNSIVAIDLETGKVVRSIALDGEPNKLVLSTDENQLYVSQDVIHGYRQIDLVHGTVGPAYPILNCQLGNTDSGAVVTSMVAMPNQPNTVAIYSSGCGTAIYDSGTPRPGTSQRLFSGDVLSGALAFSSDGGTLFLAGRWGLFSLSVDASGFTGYRYLEPRSVEPESLQYDGNALYSSDGLVYDPSLGLQKGSFTVSGLQGISGPLVSDAGQKQAFGFASNLAPTSIQKFDEGTFNAVGNIELAGVDTLTYPYVPRHLLRWGQNGLAFRTSTQIFALKNPLVR